MFALRASLCALAVILLVGFCQAQKDDAAVKMARGTVDKVEKDQLSVRTRNADGTFGATLTLKVTGTSRLSLLTVQMRSGKPVNVQRDFDVKDLKAKQPITMIYTAGPAGDVLLAAVVQPEEK